MLRRVRNPEGRDILDFLLTGEEYKGAQAQVIKVGGSGSRDGPAGNARDLDLDFIHGKELHEQVRYRITNCQETPKDINPFIDCVRSYVQKHDDELRYNEAVNIMEAVQDSKINAKNYYLVMHDNVTNDGIVHIGDFMLT